LPPLRAARRDHLGGSRLITAQAAMSAAGRVEFYLRGKMPKMIIYININVLYIYADIQYIDYS
jgi:hypothetical protein